MKDLEVKMAKWVGLRTRHEFIPIGFDRMQACRHCGAIKPPINILCCVPDFTLSLDACFQYVVPTIIKKVDGDSVEVELLCPTETSTFWTVRIENRQKILGEASGNTAPQAFCLAVEKLIDGEK